MNILRIAADGDRIKRADMRSTYWKWTTSVTNSHKAQLAISVWADALRDALDRACTP